MENKGILGKGFGQEIGVLVLRLYVRDFKLSVLDMFLQEVVAHVDVLRVRVGDRVDRQLNRTVVVLKNLDARIPKLRQEETPHRPQENRLLKAFCHCNVLSLTRGECSDFFVLEIHWIAAPPHITAPPGTDSILVSLWV